MILISGQSWTYDLMWNLKFEYLKVSKWYIIESLDFVLGFFESFLAIVTFFCLFLEVHPFVFILLLVIIDFQNLMLKVLSFATKLKYLLKFVKWQRSSNLQQWFYENNVVIWRVFWKMLNCSSMKATMWSVNDVVVVGLFSSFFWHDLHAYILYKWYKSRARTHDLHTFFIILRLGKSILFYSTKQ